MPPKSPRWPIADIRIGPRHRLDLGDIPRLADSIAEQGLLQPIGILKDGQLVFGHRRLIACRDQLGWTEIDVRIVDVTSITAGEMHENEMRKQFTPSERVAIFRSLETFKHGGSRSSGDQRPRGDVDLSSTEKAAKLAGFAGRGTAYRAEKVVKDGIPELVEAMDKRQVTITAAAKIAAQPQAAQKHHLAEAKAGRAMPATPKPKPVPHKPIGQVLLERAARAAAIPELTLEEKGYPPPELADKQHPDYPEGVTYAMAWREENGRVQLWSLAEKRKIQLTARWQEAIGQLAQLDVISLDTLNPNQRRLIEFSLVKVLRPLNEWLERNAKPKAVNAG